VDVSGLYTNTEIDDINKNRTAGVVSLPTYTDNGDGSVTLGADGIYNFSTAADGDNVNTRLTATAGETLTLTDGATNFVYVDYNSGTPDYNVTLDSSIFFSDATKVPVFRLNRDGTTVCPVDYGEYAIATVDKMLFKDVDLNGFQRSTGLVLSTAATRISTISAGTGWFGVKPGSLSANVAGSTGSLYEYYLVSGVWTKSSALSAYDSTYYSDGTDRQTLGASKWVAKYFYMCYGGSNTAYYIHGNQYTGSGDAETESIPTPPSIISGSAVYVGKIVIQQGSTDGEAFPRDWKSVENYTPVTKHPDLDDLGWTSSGHTGS
jgi:hypothetical protein